MGVRRACIRPAPCGAATGSFGKDGRFEIKRLTPLLRSRRIAAAAALAAAAFWSGCSDVPNSLSGPDPETAQASLTRIQELDIRPALEAQERHGDRLLAISGVVGHGAGVGTNGEPTVVVFTLRPGTSGIPDRVDGVPTRTVASGMFVALIDETAGIRPAAPGHVHRPPRHHCRVTWL